MIDLRNKIKFVINSETERNHFFVLNENSVNLIQQIFNNYENLNDLKPDFGNIPKNAELIFVAAPTGAGKDNLVVRINARNPEKKYIELNMDMFRHYFSEFILDVSGLKDKTFAKQTNEFAYEMYYTIQEILLTEFPGTNIIITGTLWKTDWVEETFRKYKDDNLTNYSIKIASLAVPYKQSAISVIERYAKIVDSQIDKKDFVPGTSRYTSLDYHDETFSKFPESLSYFENIYRKNPGKLIDAIEVYRRSVKIDDYSENTLVYSSKNPNDFDKTAVEVFRNLSNKEVQFNNESIIELLNLINKNKNYMKEQEILTDVVIDIGKLIGLQKAIFERKIDEKIADDDEQK